MDGVPGTGSRITLRFLRPGGAKTGEILPTGSLTDYISSSDLDTTLDLTKSSLPVTLLDVANPAVYIYGVDVDLMAHTTPTDLEFDPSKLGLLEQIREEGARIVGLDPMVDSIPKLVMVFPLPSNADGVNLVARVLSMRQPHRAIPLTIALDLSVACLMLGTLPHSVVKGDISGGRVMIGHASGMIEVGATMVNGDVEAPVLHRTARALMKGEVYWH